MTEIETSYVLTPGVRRRLRRAAYPAQAASDVGIPVVCLLSWAFTRDGLHLALLTGAVAVILWQHRALARDKDATGDLRIRMTSTSFETAWDNGSASRLWTGYTWARRRSGCWVLRVSALKRVAFPASVLDEEQTRVFRAILAENGVPVLGR